MPSGRERSWFGLSYMYLRLGDLDPTHGEVKSMYRAIENDANETGVQWCSATPHERCRARFGWVITGSGSASDVLFRIGESPSMIAGRHLGILGETRSPMQDDTVRWLGLGVLAG